jgi:hypothetical protein
MAAHRFVAVVGARVLPEAAAPQVAAVVRFFLSRGWGIGSGGARGADAFALHAVLGAGSVACARSVMFLPGVRAAGRGGALRAFAAVQSVFEWDPTGHVSAGCRFEGYRDMVGRVRGDPRGGTRCVMIGAQAIFAFGIRRASFSAGVSSPPVCSRTGSRSST